MKNLKSSALTALALMLILNSCSVEKRVYSSGYHIDWNKNKNQTEKVQAIIDETINQTSSESAINNKAPETVLNFDDNIVASVHSIIINPIASEKEVEHTEKEELAEAENMDSVVNPNFKKSKKNQNVPTDPLVFLIYAIIALIAFFVGVYKRERR
jgi:hypothetical protein